MDKEKLQYFKSKLINEKKKINEVLDVGTEFSKELSTEISFYDQNHPGDTASELYDKERGAALEQNEVFIVKKIDSALKSIEEGNFGICKRCGREICQERLDFIPYTEHCIDCQNEIGTGLLNRRNEYPVSMYFEDFGEDDAPYDDPIEAISNEQYRRQLPD